MKSVARWNYDKWILPLAKKSLVVYNFYRSSLPLAIYSEIVTPVVNESKKLLNFYFRRFPKSLYTEVCLPTIPKIRRIADFYFHKLPVETATAYAPTTFSSLRFAARFYGYGLPASVFNEILSPTGTASKNGYNFYSTVTVEFFRRFSKPVVQALYFYNNLMGYYLDYLPTILQFYCIQLPIGIWTESVKLATWTFKTLKLSTLWAYDHVLAPFGWRLYTIGKVRPKFLLGV